MMSMAMQTHTDRAFADSLRPVGAVSVPDAHLFAWAGKFLVYRPADARVELWPRRPAFVAGVTRLPALDPTPVSLTLALHRQCSLHCRYCYGRPRRRRSTVSPAPEAITAAATWVARNCRSRRLPLQVDFHGDNEPLMRLDLLQATVDLLRRVTDRIGVELRIGCTTGGLIPEHGARWALRNCDRLSLSHDGPLAQDRLRPVRGGKPSRLRVERTLDILANGERRGDLQLRATITRLQQGRQASMVDYFLDRFAIDHLVFHPIYPSPHWRRERRLDVDPRRFVRGFVVARRLAQDRGRSLEYAGSRAPERHGRHCSLLQGNLLLTADGDASLCFLALDARRAWDRRRHYGNPADPRWRPAMVANRLRRLANSAPRCRACFNLWHCEQACPSHCPLDPEGGGVFDCRIPFWIGLVDILETAGFELRGDDFTRLFALSPPIPEPHS